jgi:hypothetical protein
MEISLSDKSPFPRLYIAIPMQTEIKHYYALSLLYSSLLL